MIKHRRIIQGSYIDGLASQQVVLMYVTAAHATVEGRLLLTVV